jgi:hypothetical protein
MKSENATRRICSMVADCEGREIVVGSVVADRSSGKNFRVERIYGGLLHGVGFNGTNPNPDVQFQGWSPTNVKIAPQELAATAAARR